MNGVIDAIIVDTSAFMAEQSDFLGMNSAILPSFFQLLIKQEITLLSHQILNEEVKRNIRESMLLERLTNLKAALGKYKHVLPLINISPDEAIQKIDNLDLEHQLVDAFCKYYANASLLPYPSPESIFSLYFSSKPPFTETGKKKHEFPDAFVIEAIKQYQRDNQFRTMLVISDDPDWKSSLSGYSRILLADSISDGMKVLQSNENIIPIIESLKPQLAKDIKWYAESESYELDNYHFFVEDGLEISDVTVDDVSTDITPLSITEDSALFRTVCTLTVAGGATVRDEDNSYWDKEDSKYLFEKYVDISFDKGKAEVECEISIAFDSNDPIDSASVESIKLIVQYNIDVEVDDENIKISDPEADARADMMDTLEDYHRH